MLKDVREYIDRLHIDGHTIGEDHDDDPILIDPDGSAVDTWRENYPYDERMPREEYDEAEVPAPGRAAEVPELGRRHRDQARARSSRAATPPARAARSSASWSTSTRATPASSR